MIRIEDGPTDPPTPKTFPEKKAGPTGPVIVAQPRNGADNAGRWLAWASIGVIGVRALSLAVGAGDTGKAVYNYLSGANVMDDNELNDRIIKANPQGTLRQPMAAEQMVAQAYKESPEKGAASIDALKKRFMPLMAAGGIANEKGSLDIAAQNVNNAMRYMPDGNEVHFMPDGAGGYKVTTTNYGMVTPGNQPQTQNFHLSTDQFKQFVHGPQGKWDGLLTKDLSQVMARFQRLGVQSNERQNMGPDDTAPPPPKYQDPGLDPNYKAPEDLVMGRYDRATWNRALQMNNYNKQCAIQSMELGIQEAQKQKNALEAAGQEWENWAALSRCITVKYRSTPICLNTFTCTETP